MRESARVPFGRQRCVEHCIPSSAGMRESGAGWREGDVRVWYSSIAVVGMGGCSAGAKARFQDAIGRRGVVGCNAGEWRGRAAGCVWGTGKSPVNIAS